MPRPLWLATGWDSTHTAAEAPRRSSQIDPAHHDRCRSYRQRGAGVALLAGGDPDQNRRTAQKAAGIRRTDFADTVGKIQLGLFIGGPRVQASLLAGRRYRNRNSSRTVLSVPGCDPIITDPRPPSTGKPAPWAHIPVERRGGGDPEARTLGDRSQDSNGGPDVAPRDPLSAIVQPGGGIARAG